MNEHLTSRRRNGKALGYTVSDDDSGWGEHRSLGASVNKACAKWLENKLGYKSTFGGGRRFSREQLATRKPSSPIGSAT
jgi:hypothetical protein